MNWSSNAFYDNELVAHQSVATHLLKDLPGVKSDENTGQYCSRSDWVQSHEKAHLQLNFFLHLSSCFILNRQIINVDHQRQFVCLVSIRSAKFMPISFFKKRLSSTLFMLLTNRQILSLLLLYKRLLHFLKSFVFLKRLLLF